MNQVEKFRIEKPEKIPEKISAFIWDVNGTITFKDQLDEEVMKIILQTAIEGVQHIFITGRDRGWLVDFFVKSLKERAKTASLDYEKAIDNMWLYPELGLIHLESSSLTPTIYEGIEDHPLVSSALRQRIATLFWQTHKVQEWKEGQVVPAGYYVCRDANGKGFLFPIVIHDIDVGIKLPDFIWSDTKEIIGTAEI